MELFALIGSIGIVTAALKGHPRMAAAVAAAAVALIAAIVSQGDASDAEVSALTRILLTAGPPLWSLLAIWIATRPAAAGSPWARRRAVDGSGTSARARQPMRSRLVRAVLGAIVGVAPAVIFMTAAILAADTGDEAQLAFAGMPFAFAGIVLGALVGFNWVPRTESTTRQSPAGTADDHISERDCHDEYSR